MDSLGRRLRVLHLVRAEPGIAAPAIAAAFGVTERTARRDVERLREVGFRIASTPGRGGGYRLAPGTEVPGLLLDDDELLAVAAGLRVGTGIPDLDAATEGALAKIAELVPSRLRHRLGALVDIVAATDVRRPVDGAVLVALALAARERTAVRIHRPTDDRARTLQPLSVTRVAEMWYLVAHERGSSGWTTWALDRIERVEPLGVTLPTPEQPPDDPAAFVTRSLASGRRHRVVLRATESADAVRRLVPPAVAEVVESPDGSELRLATDDLPSAARWIAFLPLTVTVLEPDGLRIELARLARTLAERHAAPAG